MNTRKTRIEIVSKTSTLLLLNHDGRRRTEWCSQCSMDVLWIGPAAMTLLGISDPQEIEEVHTRGEEICSRSLIAKISEEKKNDEPIIKTIS